MCGLIIVCNFFVFIALESVILLQCDKLKTKIADVKNVIANKDNKTPDEIRQQTSDLQQASLKLFEMAYKKVI